MSARPDHCPVQRTRGNPALILPKEPDFGALLRLSSHVNKGCNSHLQTHKRWQLHTSQGSPYVPGLHLDPIRQIADATALQGGLHRHCPLRRLSTGRWKPLHSQQLLKRGETHLLTWIRPSSKPSGATMSMWMDPPTHSPNASARLGTTESIECQALGSNVSS